MKKLLSLLLATVLFAIAFFSYGTASFATEATDDLGIRFGNSDTYYKYDGETKTLYINGKGAVPDLSLNSSSIPWFDWESGTIQNVVVSEGITSLGNNLFHNVDASSFSLPRTLKRIGKYTFASTSKMTNWDIPFGVEQIDDKAFYNCFLLESIHLPSTVKRIGEGAFYQCFTLESITIPSAVSFIGNKAFFDCKNLKEVNFSSMTQSVKLSQNAFLGCTSLKHVDVPMNAVCNSKSLGFSDAYKKVEGFTMGVYENSVSHSYAIGNGFAYTFLDSIPIKCGVEYANAFTESNENDVFHYTFSPDKTQEYILYSVGGCDTYGKLYLDGKLLAENDDIDKSQNGFGIRQKFEAGKTYDLLVNSEKMTGNFSVYAYPTDVNGFSIYNGKINFSASDYKESYNKRYFEITLSMLSDFVIDLSFADGTVGSVYYTDYVAGEHIKMLDTQDEVPFTCGDNEAKISFGDKTATYTVHIDHSYTEKYIEPTPDDDGYTLHTCILCGDSYKENFVPTDSYIVTGRCVMDEDDFGGHSHNIPYSHAYITVDGRRYEVNSDGTWTIRTFEDCYITFNNYYGGNSVKKIQVSKNGSYDFGTVVLEGYDLNGDGWVNGKDYAIYYKEMKDELGEDYWQFANEFLIYQ
ncbi:leucine-rich repeat domain-containing protein [uncultured Eubacterium sp.]|uniref:leucine-rich repeat domain-containing protein n=1 Tax=uncultured Eubacterium sp. TaxID=165185 RepID=UPI0025DB824B|nr:leucine-rich repeat domain-containing protein [uncultured Eubacterium sp.]